MNLSVCSLEEQVGRWEDQRDVKNLMGIYVNHIIMNMDADIFDALWSTRDDVCYGPEAVKGYYAAIHDRNVLVAELLQKKFPEEIGQRTAEENFGIGTFRDFPVACPVIEVAGDGQTAKGLWYCWGSQAQVLSCGPTSSWTWGYYAADFVREGNSWKIWHLQITNDVDARCGTDCGPGQPGQVQRPAPADRVAQDPGALPYVHRHLQLRHLRGGIQMEEKKLTLEQQMGRIWDVEQVKQLMHKRVFLQTWDRRQEELDTLWVTGPELQKTASYGSNWGYYVGMEAIRGYYVDAHQANEAMAQPDGTADVRWMLGKVAADFVREADGWRLWHIVVSTDVDCQAGHDYGEYPVYEDWSAGSANPVRREFGTPTVEMLTHDVTFNWWDDYPPMPPKNYKTWSDDISYGPEGYRPPAVIGLRAGEGRNWK